MFPGERGQPLKPWTLYGGSFKRDLKRAGLPEGITFHEATRHTCATVHLSKGVHPKLVQESPWTPTATFCRGWTTV